MSRKEFDESQYKQIKEDLEHFTDNKEMMRNTLMLYILDVNYSRASISKAVSEIEKEHNIQLS